MIQEKLFLYWQQTIKPFHIENILANQAFTDVVNTYSQPYRHYHNLKHLDHVLSTINTLQIYAQDLPSVKLAAWFHDIIYNTHAQDNEDKSADYAANILENLGIPTSNINTVHQLILNTKNHQSNDLDSQVLLDADLAILAAKPVEYQEYAQAIRQEYAWVSELEYITGRRQVLKGFLQRERIYFTPLMFESGEKSARDNLEREINNLSP